MHVQAGLACRTRTGFTNRSYTQKGTRRLQCWQPCCSQEHGTMKHPGAWQSADDCAAWRRKTVMCIARLLQLFPSSHAHQAVQLLPQTSTYACTHLALVQAHHHGNASRSLDVVSQPPDYVLHIHTERAHPSYCCAFMSVPGASSGPEAAASSACRYCGTDHAAHSSTVANAALRACSSATAACTSESCEANR